MEFVCHLDPAYTQTMDLTQNKFYEAVRIAANYEPNCDSVLKKAVNILKNHSADCCRHNKNVKRIEFLTHQLGLATQKNFSVSDYCFAIESFPNCHYEQLREFLILPSKRKQAQAPIHCGFCGSRLCSRKNI